ncbi:actin cross-linking domain-containing toxin [Saccharothrix syringae]|nr:actin cross-linking domain-containing toxin [Saccharothrix syringae]
MLFGAAVRLRPAARRQPEGAPEFGKVFRGVSIGSESELTGLECALPAHSVQTFAYVESAETGRPLVRITKDMDHGDYPARPGWRLHTVELITYPALKSDEHPAEDYREPNAAVLFVLSTLNGIGLGEARPLESHEGGGGRFRLVVTNRNHVIVKRASSAGMPRAGQQLTAAISTRDLLFREGAMFTSVQAAAPWYRPELAGEATLPDEPACTDEKAVRNLYAFLASMIDFVAALAKKHRFGIEGYRPGGTPSGLALTDPRVKNDWRVLPRTKCATMLEALGGDDQRIVRILLSERYPDNPTAEYAAYQYVIFGLGTVAGHTIDDASVAGTRAALFEFRSVPGELVNYLPDARELNPPVADPLERWFGKARPLAVRAINQIAGENEDEFARWFRERFAEKRNAKDPLQAGTALQKAEWIRSTREQDWKSITDRYPPPS